MMNFMYNCNNNALSGADARSNLHGYPSLSLTGGGARLRGPLVSRGHLSVGAQKFREGTIWMTILLRSITMRPMSTELAVRLALQLSAFDFRLQLNVAKSMNYLDSQNGTDSD